MDIHVLLPINIQNTRERNPCWFPFNNQKLFQLTIFFITMFNTRAREVLSNQGPGQKWANETMKADVSLRWPVSPD